MRRTWSHASRSVPADHVDRRAPSMVLICTGEVCVLRTSPSSRKNVFRIPRAGCLANVDAEVAPPRPGTLGCSPGPKKSTTRRSPAARRVKATLRYAARPKRACQPPARSFPPPASAIRRGVSARRLRYPSSPLFDAPPTALRSSVSRSRMLFLGEVGRTAEVSLRVRTGDPRSPLPQGRKGPSVSALLCSTTDIWRCHLYITPWAL